MSEPKPSSASDRAVDDIVRSGEALSEYLALNVALRLTRTVAALHAAGKLHRAIVAHVTFDSNGDVELQPAPASVTVDGSALDLATWPPELHGVKCMTLPIEAEVSQETLRRAGFSFDPCRIDVYQLGVVLCQLATGEPVDSYLRSPKVKAGLSPKTREIIDSALGYDSVSRYSSAAALAAAIQACVDTPAIERETDVLTPDGEHDADSAKFKAHRLASDEQHAASQAALPFQKLGHYEILEPIGSGGMGDVYKGYERSLDRVVAIKVLPPELGRDESFVRRFYAEASAAAELIHPNITQIFFIGEDAGHHFFAMQYIQGETVADVLARRPRLSVDETLTIIEQVLAGLAAAHRQHLVHRDVKPGNILIDRKHERVLLADFGLVKSRGDRMTVTGVIMGTVDYISPEQGRGKTVDSRSDLYSVGVLMYQMLSGRLPFEADSATAMIFQHVYQQPRPLFEVAPDVPAPLAALIAKLMAKDPGDRPQTAERVLEEVLTNWPSPRSGSLPSSSDEIVTDVEIVDESPRTSVISAPAFDERPPSAIELPEPPRTSWWTRERNRLLGRMQAYAPELSERLQGTQQLVDGAVAEYQRRRDQLQALISEAEEVRQELADQAKYNQEARQAQQLREDEVQGAEELEQALQVQTEELETMRANLARLDATLAGLRSQRDQLNARLKLANVQRAPALSPAQHRIRRLRSVLALGVGGAVLVTAGLLIAGYAIRAARRSVESTLSGIANSDLPIYRTRYQLFNRGYDPKTLQPNESSIDVSEIEKPSPAMPLRHFIGHEGTVTQVAFNSTGTLLASAGYDYAVRLWDPQTGIEINKFEGSQLTAFDTLSFSADGRFLAAGTNSGIRGSEGLTIWDVTTGQVVHRMAKDRSVGTVAFSPTDSRLAILEPGYAKVPTMVTLWSSQTAAQTGSVDPGAKVVGNSLAYSPDGTRLAFVVDPYRIVLWNVSQSRVERSIAFEYVVQENAVLAFSPRGDVLAVAGGAFAGGYNVAENYFGEVQMFAVASGDQIGSFRVPEATELASVAFHPSEPLVAAATDKGVRVWDIRSGEVVQLMETHVAMSIAFSPDGSTLATGGRAPDRTRSGKQYPWLLLWEIKTSQSLLREDP